jgi:hypothetical protein
LQSASALGKEGADGTKQKEPEGDLNSGHVAGDVTIDTLFARDVQETRFPAFGFYGFPFLWLLCRTDLRGAE